MFSSFFPEHGANWKKFNNWKNTPRDHNGFNLLLQTVSELLQTSTAATQ
jgi:uncharacterized protein with NRDE domain